ncbi:MAG TPA: hypothetical protein VF031_04880 [Alphaproteobacteria bacterium]
MIAGAAGTHPAPLAQGLLIMLASLLLQIIGWAVVLGTLFTLLDRLGVFSRPARFTEETMTRLWRESAMTSGEESGPAPNRLA